MTDSSFVQQGRGAATWHSLDLQPHERIEVALMRLFSTATTRVLEIALIQQPEDGYSYREDAAYVLHSASKRALPGSAEVSVVFLRSHAGGSGPCVEYCTYAESQFPHAFDCPGALLERLAPPVDAMARIWREQCWLRHRHQLRPGDLVTFHALAPGLAAPTAHVPYRVEWQDGDPYPFFVHLGSGQRSSTPLWRMLPYTLHHLGEQEVARGVCSECGATLSEPGVVCALCVPRYLEHRACFSEYVRALDGKLARAPYGAIWAPDRFVEGAGYYLSRLSPPLQGNTHRFSKIDLFVPAGCGDELARVWLGHCIEGVVQRAVESVGGFPLSLVPIGSWSPFDPHPAFAHLYMRPPGLDQEGVAGRGWQGD